MLDSLFKWKLIKQLNSLRKFKMINFATLFSQFRNNSNSAINDLLDQQNIDLGRLMDEDSFVNEYKSGNNKLVQFMKYDKISQLIEYVTVVGPAQDRRRSFKFPQSASEVLSSETSNLPDFFFPDTQIYLDQLTYEDQEVQIEVQEDSINSIEQTPNNQPKESQIPPKTIIEQKLESQISPPQNQEKQESEQVKQTQKKSNQKVQKIESPTEKQENQQQKKKIISEGNSQNQLKEQKVVEEISKQKKQDEQIKQEQSSPTNTKEKIKVKQTRRVEKIIKKPVQPLIGKLFDYFSGPVNYTLAGYVCKVLLVLLTKKTNSALKFLLQPQNRNNILNHAQSRSVCELIIKILTLETTQFLAERSSLYKQLIDRLSINSQTFILSNLSACACQTLEKCILNLKSNNPIKQLLVLYFSPQDIGSIINNVMSKDENVSVYNSPVLLTYLVNIPLNAPENQQLLEGFQKTLQVFIDKACEKLAVTKKQRKALGLGRVKILEILSFILKENILDSRDLVGKKVGFFQILFTLCNNYEMNNVLHNQVVKILDVAFSSSSESAILKSLIEDDILLNFLVKEYKEDAAIRAGSNKKKSRKGYIGHVVLICNKIRQCAKTNQLLARLLERKQFDTVLTELVDKQTFESNKSLAGFSLRKNLPQKVMFQKQEIITEYLSFLTKCPLAIVQQDLNKNQALHPDLIQELERELQDNLKIAEQPVIEVEPNHQTHSYQEAANHKYWEKHIQYNVEELMNDL